CCAEPSGTSVDGRNRSKPASAACQPKELEYRPNTASNRPVPPNKATIESVLHTTASEVNSLPTSDSGGQLFVYEYGRPGRRAAAVHAVQAMKATIRRD